MFFPFYVQTLPFILSHNGKPVTISNKRVPIDHISKLQGWTLERILSTFSPYLHYDHSPKYLRISGAKYSGVLNDRDVASLIKKAEPKSINFKDFIYHPSKSINKLSVFTSEWTIPHYWNKSKAWSNLVVNYFNSIESFLSWWYRG